jgi:hypothetical protein
VSGRCVNTLLITFVPGSACLSFDKHANEAAYQTKRALLKPLFGKLHNMPLRIQRSETFGAMTSGLEPTIQASIVAAFSENESIQFSARTAEGARPPDAAISLIIPAPRLTPSESVFNSAICTWASN